MKKFIGCKLVQAELDTSGEFYKILYPDGYESKSPRDVFEKAYMQVGDNNTITQELVDSFIVDVEAIQLGDKTTVVKVTLVNGFTIVEASSCVDVANFSMEIGAEICMERIKNKLWELLGFVLQTAVHGIKE